MTNNKNNIYLSDIHEKLMQDKDGALRDQITKVLQGEMNILQKLLKKGVSIQEHKKIISLIHAVASAGDVVGRVWKKQHKKTSNTIT